MSKNVFKLGFKFLGFPDIPKIPETHAHKKFNLQHNRQIKITVFWSDHKIKMPWNVVFKLNRHIKMPQNSKVVKKARILKCRQNFLP